MKGSQFDLQTRSEEEITSCATKPREGHDSDSRQYHNASGNSKRAVLYGSRTSVYTVLTFCLELRIVYE